MGTMLLANPVLVKELRGWMRGDRAFVLLTATLVLLALVSFGLYSMAYTSAQVSASYGSVVESAEIGQVLFAGLAFVALGVICFIAPALTAGAVSGEHERRTFDLLMATPLHPASMLFGKLTASLSYAFVLLLATVPLASLSYVFGGVTMVDMLKALLLLLSCTVTFGVIGVFFSAWLRRTVLATVLSYVALLVLVFGTLFIWAWVGTTLGYYRSEAAYYWLLVPNPFMAMSSALANVVQFDPKVLGLPLWCVTVALYTGLTLVLYLASTRLVQLEIRLSKLAKVLVCLILTVLVMTIVYQFYLMTRMPPVFNSTTISLS
ncbi:MAG: ABC transporter permease subunit [Thermoflexales bacterium]|nr:ABC transporter permease subunit [Thermoflexales bacterium]